jgi:uncharacterized phage protein gp47/JayE
MSFQVKDYLSILASLINYMRATQDQITDFNVGGVARTLVSAPAIEIDELYQMMFRGLKESIPVSIYNSFAFDLLPAIGASGSLRFTLSPVSESDITIPSGTSVSVPGGVDRFLTSVDVVIPPGSTTVDVIAYCSSTGFATNVAAATLTEMQTQISGVTVTNLNAFSNGRDLETDADRYIRFREYISNIARGTVSAIKYGATTAVLLNESGGEIERVAAVSVVEAYAANQNAYVSGLVFVYIYNGSGGTSAELVARAQDIIDGYYLADGTPVPGWKAAGVIVEVLAAVEVEVDVTASVVMSAGYDSDAAIAEATAGISAYIAGLGIGAAAIRSEMISIIMAVDGVYNCTISMPSGDIAVGEGDKIVSGTVLILDSGSHPSQSILTGYGAVIAGVAIRSGSHASQSILTGYGAVIAGAAGKDSLIYYDGNYLFNGTKQF